MSLHAAAKHLAAQGRRGDTHLVHMTSGEVRSLQDLAKAHGGSLTTNPHTGLPEASFLSAVLPMAAGAAMTGLSGGAINPMTAGLIMGGLGYATTGSLTKGLMAGLGAYGGAGLGAGLSNLGAVSSEAGLTSGANALGTDAAAFKAAPEKFFLDQAASNPAGIDAFGNVPGAAGYDMSTAGATVNEGAQKAFTDAYAQGMKPSMANMGAGAKELFTNPSLENLKTLGGGSWTDLAKYGGAALAQPIADAMAPKPLTPLTTTSMPNPVYEYRAGRANPTPVADPFGVEQNYFPTAGYTRVAAEGGEIKGYAIGGMPVGAQNMSFPQSGIPQGQYSNAWQTPVPREMLASGADVGASPMTGSMNFASGGLSDLGGYSDGGRLLRGPGDGVSDSIPAVIGKKQPARLADGEFVVPARIVSEIGNGSTEAGARKLYAMMDRVQKARGKTVGKGKVAKNTRADKYLPA